MKRIVKSLFVPLSMMIATSAFAQMGGNSGSGGSMPQTQTPTTNTMSQQTPATSTQSNMGQMQQSNIGGRPTQGILPQTSEQRQQQRVQDSLNRAQKKAAREQKKAEKKARKQEKKEKQSMPSDTTGTHAVLEKAIKPAYPEGFLS